MNFSGRWSALRCAAAMTCDRCEKVDRLRLDWPAIVDLDIAGFWRQVEFRLACRDMKLEIPHHLAVFSPAYMLFVIVAHTSGYDEALHHARGKGGLPHETGPPAQQKPRICGSSVG